MTFSFDGTGTTLIKNKLGSGLAVVYGINRGAVLQNDEYG
jgi:hypothetical protein